MTPNRTERYTPGWEDADKLCPVGVTHATVRRVIQTLLRSAATPMRMGCVGTRYRPQHQADDPTGNRSVVWHRYLVALEHSGARRAALRASRRRSELRLEP